MSPSLPVILAAGEPSYTPSNYMPSVLVEIAFNAGYVTPAASRVWTDVTDYAELHDNIGIFVGRQDERSTADANTLTLTLDNKDGRFTALRSASPYYPNVKIGRPIRVSATTADGVASIRFVGFIDEWPVEWDGSDAYAKATIRASSRMSRLGLTAKLRSAIEQEILGPSPAAYYTLGDPSGARSASESSSAGLVGPLMPSGVAGTTAAVFGNAVGVASDGLTAMTFPVDSETWLVQLPAMTVRTVRLCFIADAGASAAALLLLSNGSTFKQIDHNGSGASYSVSASGLTGGAAAPGALHDLVWTNSAAGGERLYLDGVEVGAGPGTDYTNVIRLTLKPGSNARALTFCHVALYDVILTPAQVALQAQAALSGFAGDRTDARSLRILGWVGVAPEDIVADAGSETMAYQLTTGMSAVDALRECESTEGGVLFDGADGNVKFHNRSRRYLKTPSATLNMASQHVGSDYAPRLDRSALVNDVTVENPTTGETARAVDTTSSDEYGIATGSATSVANSYAPLHQKAAWAIASYAEPRMRVPSLTVDVLAHQGLTPSAATLLGITVGDVIAVTNAPTQADTTSPSYFVEGYTESIGPESYEITFNLSPTYPTLNTFVLDDATRGKLDAGNVLAY